MKRPVLNWSAPVAGMSFAYCADEKLVVSAVIHDNGQTMWRSNQYTMHANIDEAQLHLEKLAKFRAQSMLADLKRKKVPSP